VREALLHDGLPVSEARPDPPTQVAGGVHGPADPAGHAIEGGSVDVFDAIDGGSAPTTDDSAQAAVAPADERSVHLVDPICGLLQRVSDDSAHLTGLVRLHYSRVT